jgi:hypothetical protein
MRVNHPISEQLFNCSDIYASFYHQLAPQTPNSGSTPAPLGPPRGTRLAHRALSALRQTRLPLRQGPRSWPQILFVCELPQGPTATPIPLAATALRGSGFDQKLSARARSVGTDMRHQSRTHPPPRKSLSDAAGGLADRSSAGGASGRHHAAVLPSVRCVFGLGFFGVQHRL